MEPVRPTEAPTNEVAQEAADEKRPAEEPTEDVAHEDAHEKVRWWEWPLVVLALPLVYTREALRWMERQLRRFGTWLDHVLDVPVTWLGDQVERIAERCAALLAVPPRFVIDRLRRPIKASAQAIRKLSEGLTRSWRHAAQRLTAPRLRAARKAAHLGRVLRRS